MRQLSKVKNLKDALLVMLKPPGWRPSYIGEALTPKEIEPNRKLYDANAQPKVTVYIVVQFILLLAFASYFLFSVAQFSLPKQIVSILFIFISSVTIGTMFENKKWSFRLEFLRILMIIPMLYFLIYL